LYSQHPHSRALTILTSPCLLFESLPLSETSCACSSCSLQSTHPSTASGRYCCLPRRGAAIYRWTPRWMILLSEQSVWSPSPTKVPTLFAQHLIAPNNRLGTNSRRCLRISRRLEGRSRFFRFHCRHKGVVVCCFE
jgi:hypothetical protein